MKKEFIIQEEIKVSQKWIDTIIEYYKGQSDTFCIGIGGFSGDKQAIIKEIQNLTEAGKQILMIIYRFEHSEYFQRYFLKEAQK